MTEEQFETMMEQTFYHTPESRGKFSGPLTVVIHFIDENGNVRLICDYSTLKTLMKAGFIKNIGEEMPSTTKKQQKFMGADYARAKEGKKTKTGMSKEKLKHFAEGPVKKK